MTSIESRIQGAAARNSELLSILKETDHAVPDLENQIRYLAELDQRLQESAKRIGVLDKKRQKELKEHEKYRDSNLRRLFYKIGKKEEEFQARADKEERDYIDALQESHRESNLRNNLEAMLREAHEAKATLEKQAARHREAQNELDGLYDSIFQGPTPDFPEEDTRESEAESALRSYHQVRVRTEGEAQAVRLLSEAQRRMRDAVGSIGQALRFSEMDMWGIGGSTADMMERNALHKADVSIRDARMLALQASKFSPFVKEDAVPKVNVAQGSVISDMFFDNIFADMAFHDKIEKSLDQVVKCAKVVGDLAGEARKRQANLEGELRVQEAVLESARAALQEARERVFERAVGATRVEGMAGIHVADHSAI